MYLSLVLAFISIFWLSCSKDDVKVTTTGTLKGVVTSLADNKALANVRVVLFDATTNAPTNYSALTGNDGSYSFELKPGAYYLKLSSQGYIDIPVQGTTPVTVTVELGKETVGNYQMQQSTVANGGFITGTVTSGGKAVAGVMVVASDATSGYSTVSDVNGNYFIYNIPAGSYKVKGFVMDYNSNEIDANVTSGTETSGKNIDLTSGATGSLTGTVSFLATNNGEVDVTLTHPQTKETIPGLATKTSAGTYSLSKIPNGIYIARATFKNDGYVIDPDWILKNGEPTVTVDNNSLSLNFSVTGAVKIISPASDSATAKPIEIADVNPTFSWTAYSSVSDYVIEVSDVNGNVIWGGFTKSGATITKNIVIPKSQYSIVYNSDGKATAALKKGTIYRWKIYASKDDSKEASGWKLISVSEDQRGLFIIK